MTVTNHTALYRFTFPGPGEPSSNVTFPNTTAPAVPSLPYNPLILLDLTDLPNTRSNATINVDPDTGRIMATGTFNPSFGVGSYTLHACADFQGAAIRDTGVFRNNRAGSEPKTLSMYMDGVSNANLPGGAWVRFEPPDLADQILVRVGVSFISVVQACQNAETEIPDFDLEETREAAVDAWARKLSVISVESTGVNSTFLKVFWSGLYRSMLSPQDYTGVFIALASPRLNL